MHAFLAMIRKKERHAMKYVIEGIPIPLARPRLFKDRVYDSQKVDKDGYKMFLKLSHAHSKLPELEGAISFEANFYMPIPKSWSEKKKQMMIGKHHISKPDWSNLLKFVEDCCTGILFKDDALIAKVCGVKVYDLMPRTEIILMEME